ncbi:hypothetical protein [Streptomyces sp. NPDC001750]|uniref:hypothetical protein n=1 Tax=Streptomyces sp. NPDC001750 TaxID=3364607 RepID=UPI0036BA26B2
MTRQAAYDAVYTYIRGLGTYVPTGKIGRNALIWDGVNRALEAADAPPRTPVVEQLLAGLVDDALAATLADGTGSSGDDARAQCARTALQMMIDQGELAWRDIVWAQLATAITETDPVQLRAALAPVVGTITQWISALNQRIAAADRPSPAGLAAADLAQALEDAREKTGHEVDPAPECAEAMAEHLLKTLHIHRRPA